MRRFICDCGNALYFGNTKCLRCAHEVGYDPDRRTVLRLSKSDTRWRRCDNGIRRGVCNWLLPNSSAEKLCVSCQMNRTVPDLNWGRNRYLWGIMEMAKRQMLYGLQGLGIPISSKTHDPANGLAFDIVSTVLNPSITTGHLNGVITVNLEEADDTYRQINRQQLGENSRTLLGHFRHESAHYLWGRFLSGLPPNDPLRAAFRTRFGDELREYGAALQAYYQGGAPAGWEHHFISAYATAHPWEDWAETWAHYLQIVDGLETCDALGIQVQTLTVPLVMLPAASGLLPEMLSQSPADDDAFLAMLQRWLCLSTVFNEVSDSLGEHRLYPFIISSTVAQKLRLAHYFASRWGRSDDRVPSLLG